MQKAAVLIGQLLFLCFWLIIQQFYFSSPLFICRLFISCGQADNGFEHIILNLQRKDTVLKLGEGFGYGKTKTVSSCCA